MKNLRVNNAAGTFAGLRKGNLCAKFFASARFFILFFASSSFHQTLQAQIIWKDLGDFKLGYELSTTASTLEPYQQFSIKLYADVLSQAEAIGVSFSLNLDTGIQIDPTAPISLPSSSWLGVVSDLSSGFQGTPADAEAWVYRADSSSKSGNGLLVTLHAQAGSASISSQSLVQSFGGSIIIVDDLDMGHEYRQTAAQNAGQAQSSDLGVSDNSHLTAPSSSFQGFDARPSLKAFPNPCIDQISIDSPSNDPTQVSIIDHQGRPIRKALLQAGQSLDLSQVPRGSYLLIMEQSGQQYTQKLLKQ